MNVTSLLTCLASFGFNFTAEYQIDTLYTYVVEKSPDHFSDAYYALKNCTTELGIDENWNLASFDNYNQSIDSGQHEPFTLPFEWSLDEAVSDIESRDVHEYMQTLSKRNQVEIPMSMQQWKGRSCGDSQRGQLCTKTTTDKCMQFSGRSGGSVFSNNEDPNEVDFMYWLHHQCSSSGSGDSKKAKGNVAHQKRKSTKCYQNNILSYWAVHGKGDKLPNNDQGRGWTNPIICNSGLDL